MEHRKLDYDSIKHQLSRRDREAHKGSYGHVLVIGGDKGFGGAALMTGMSAARSGAGLVSVATHPDHCAAFLARCPELMVKGVQDSADLVSLMPSATVIVLGPGLGQSDWSQVCLKLALSNLTKHKVPVVLDADALNLLCHLSGVASLTREWADALAGTSAAVRDTRKTTPGMRALEKYAVRCGGGVNHRMGLSDMALVKDNHVAAAGGVVEAYTLVKALESTISVQIEVDSVDVMRLAIESGADDVLIDNFTLGQMREAVHLRNALNPNVRLEASGGLTVDTARQVAETGVDFIAVGELTHSSRVLDFGLDLQEVL